MRGFLTLAVLLIAGCAVTPNVQHEQPVSNLASYKFALIVVDGSDAIQKQTGYEPTSAALRKEFTDNVKNSGRYTLVDNAKGDNRILEIRLTIVSLSYVHGATRGFVGIMGGHAVLAVKMTLTDKSTGEVLGMVTAGDTSHQMQGIFSATTGRQVTAVVQELAAKL